MTVQTTDLLLFLLPDDYDDDDVGFVLLRDSLSAERAVLSPLTSTEQTAPHMESLWLAAVDERTRE